MENLPEITILVPTFNRHKFLSLFLMNIKNQTYPQDKLKIIIDDDGTDKFITDIEAVKKHIYPVQLTYIDNKPHRSIGKKRNDLVKACKTKIFCFMDDDDIYFPPYVMHSYETLKQGKYGCVGTDCMLFCMTDNDYKIHAINCGGQVRQIHEATIMGTKKWFRACTGFATKGTGEGKKIFDGFEKQVGFTDINQCMMCIQHNSNTVDKLQFARDDNTIDLTITDEIKNILESILHQ